jgi:hypothetical protein
MSFNLIIKNQSRKVGDMPVSYSPRKTCPDTCSLKNNGCYGDNFPIRLHWDRMSNDQNDNWDEFVSSVRKFRQENPDRLWRYNIVGDIVGNNGKIDFPRLKKLVKANNGGDVIAYTHKYTRQENLAHIRYAVKRGFNINLSADTTEDAISLHKKTKLPTTAVLSVTKRNYEKLSDSEKQDYRSNLSVNKIVICPEQTGAVKDCQSCKLCSNPKRKSIVGFLKH